MGVGHSSSKMAKKASFSYVKSVSHDAKDGGYAKKSAFPLMSQAQELQPYRKEMDNTEKPSQESKCQYEKGLLLNDLEKVTRMASGTFGNTYLVKSSVLGKLFALKKIKKQVVVEGSEQKNIIRENDILQLCKCDFIVSLLQTYRDERYVYMLMEACMGGNLWYTLKRKIKISNKLAKFYAASIVEALAYLQENNVVHRDIQPDNLLLDEQGYLKLAGFGHAKVLQPGQKTWTICGTSLYLAPEMIRGQEYDHAVDLWSFGVVTFELLSRVSPFHAGSIEDIYRKACLGIKTTPFPANRSSKAKDLIYHLCEEKSTSRLGYSKNGIVNIRQHEWFRNFDWAGLRSRTYKPDYVPQVSHGLDTRHFMYIAEDEWNDSTSAVPIEISGWDENFDS